MNRNNSIDFFIVGAAKSGTTILWHWLRGHPHIFLPSVKEPHYFCFAEGDVPHHGAELDPHYKAQITTRRADYDRLFADARGDARTGDASPGYLYFPESAERICDHNPDAKIICVLRDPVRRAFSQYMHHVRDGYEDADDFETALAREDARVDEGWWWGYHYARAGDYASQWERYCRLFPESQRLLLTYDEVEADPGAVYRRVCDFLNIAPDPAIDFDRRVNVTAGLAAVPRFGALQRLLAQGSLVSRMVRRFLPEGVRHRAKALMIRANRKAPPELSPAARRALAARYGADVEKLRAMSGLKLSGWLSQAQSAASSP